jgi:hypothetical protein
MPHPKVRVTSRVTDYVRAQISSVSAQFCCILQPMSLLRRNVDPEHVWEYRTVRSVRYGRQDFDRMEFALEVLAALAPEHVDVMLYKTHHELRVDEGRAWRKSYGHMWALVGIPESATREEIVLCLIKLSGLEETPYWLSMLLAE